MQADVSGMQNVADSGLQENAGASGVFVRNGDRYTFREHYLR